MLDKFKIKVNNESEGEEAQELFEKIGYSSGHFYVENFPRWVVTEYDEDWYSTGFDFYVILPNHKELTLPQLRDIVALHRNDVNDATHADQDRRAYLDCDGKYHFYIHSTKKWYFDQSVQYVAKELKPIQPTLEQDLISGADALRALADGKEVEYFSNADYTWKSIFKYHPSLETIANNEIDINHKFRLKPRTIKFEVEIPKPFQPKVGEFAFYLDGSCKDGFDFYQYDGIDLVNPLWRSSEEIKQVVTALRNSIKGVDNV